MSNSITIDNVGPIHHLDLPIPEGGGIVVLRGRNGRGKSHALAAVGALVRPDRLPVRDGQAKGSVDGCGVTLSIGRRSTRRGDLAVRILDGEDPSLFVDPGLKDPEAADRKRLEALLRMVGAACSLDMFSSLVDGIGDLDEIAKPETARSTDLPDMAARLKRDLEAAARLQEGHAENAHGRAQALSVAKDTPADPVDMASLRTALEAANVAAAREEERCQAATEAADRAAEARTQLMEAEAAYNGPTAEEAGLAVMAAGVDVQSAMDAMEAAQRALSDARQHKQLAESVHEAAQRHEATVARWRKALDAGEGREPDTAAMDAARAEAEAASQALEDAAVMVERQKERQAYVDAIQRAKDCEARAAQLRDAAAATEHVLTEAFAEVAPEGLRVDGGRLIVDTQRGPTCLGELSPGERWSISLGIACRVGCDLMAIPQEAWEALDPPNRAAAVAAAKEHGVVIITAEASDGELRVEVEA